MEKPNQPDCFPIYIKETSRRLSTCFYVLILVFRCTSFGKFVRLLPPGPASDAKLPSSVQVFSTGWSLLELCFDFDLHDPGWYVSILPRGTALVHTATAT